MPSSKEFNSGCMTRDEQTRIASLVQGPLGASKDDAAFNFKARMLSLERTHAAMERAFWDRDDCSIGSQDCKTRDPRFVVDVAMGTPLRDDWGIRKLTFVVPADSPGNRIMDGINATERQDPRTLEVVLVGGSGEPSDTHPCTFGHMCQHLDAHAIYPNEAVDWTKKILHERRPKDGPDP